MIFMKCPQCKAAMEKARFDVGYGIAVDSMHCAKCGFNVTAGGEMKKALGSLRERMSKEVKIIKVGTGVGIRFPNDFVREYGLKFGGHALVTPEGGGIKIVAKA